MCTQISSKEIIKEKKTTVKLRIYLIICLFLSVGYNREKCLKISSLQIRYLYSYDSITNKTVCLQK